MTHHDHSGPGPTADHTLVEEHKGIYYGTIAVYALLLIVIWALCPSNIKLWVLVAEVLHIILSIVIFRLEERGGIVMLGIPLIEKRESGPVFAIWGLMEPVRVSTNYIQHQFPGEPEQVFYEDDKVLLPHGMVRPFRVTSGGPRAGYNSHLNIQMTTMATGTVRYEIEQPLTFWTRISGHDFDDKVEELRRQLMDTWTGTIATEWEQRPIGLVIEQGETIRATLRQRIEEATESLGIRILETTLNSPNLSHELSTELVNIGKANAQAEQMRTLAGAERVRLSEEGAGAASARLAMLQAEGDGAKYQANAAGITGREAFAAQTAANVIGKTDKVIIGEDGLSKTVASGAVIIDSLKQKAAEGTAS